MLDHSDTIGILPAEGLPPPNVRRGQADRTIALPPDTIVFSADGHVDVSEDIFYDKFPAGMKDRAPRVWYADSVFHIGKDGKSFLPYEFTAPLAQYDDLPGAGTGGIDARIADLTDEGIDSELTFPNNAMVLAGLPDLEVRELCYRIYNEKLAEMQERAPGRFYGVGIINWWDPKGTRRTLEECKALGLKTYMLPQKPGLNSDGKPIDWASEAMTPVWEEIEASGLPVSHHIGESPAHSQFNGLSVGLVHNMASFREMFAKYIFGGILDRHPSLQVGWFEGGINWVVSALQDVEHVNRALHHMHDWKLQHPVRHYWQQHMVSSFIVDPLGLELIDKIGRDRVMWSSDYPHSESTFGFSKDSMQSVVDAVGFADAPAILGGNVMRFLKM